MNRKIFAIAVFLLPLIWGKPAIAQIVPDDTLGNERSEVAPLDGQGFPIDLIQGGASRGANLFHSFLQFGVAEGRGVYFDRLANTQNVLVRVTGREPSQILGTLGVIPLTGDAAKTNLFLINPNGIVFGTNASLDIPGSFFATTASAIGLGNSGLFSASEPEKSNLLAVKPSALLFSAIAEQTGIEVRSQAASTVLGELTFGLQVPNGETLLLLGGEVNINGGQINAWGGRIEIGAIASQGLIPLNSDNSLTIPSTVSRADVLFQEGASADVRLDKDGTLTVLGRNLFVRGSDLLSGIAPSFGSAGNSAGNLTLDGTSRIQVEQQSLIANDVGTNATGNAGNITIKAPTLNLTDASQIRSRASGSGNGGNVTVTTNQLNAKEGAYISVSNQFGQGGLLQVTADSIDLDGGNAIPSPPTSLLAQNFSTEEGAKLSIQTRTLNIRDGAGISTATFGQGKGGDLAIRATESITIEGISSINPLIPSLILASAINTSDNQLSGKGGNLSIQTRKLTIRDGAKIEASTSRTGQAGNIDIDATESIQIIGGSRGTSDGILAKSENTFNTDSKEIGNAGRINLKAGSLVLQNGAIISTTTETGGDGGEIQIRANSLALRENSAILAGTASDGNSGSLRINAEFVDLTGESYIASSTVSRGDSGDIALTTGQLVMKEGAFISTATLSDGTGKGGDLTVDAKDSISILGTTSDGKFSTALSSETLSSGDAGTLRIQTKKLSVQDGGAIITQTSTQGQGGDIIIDAPESIDVAGGTFTQKFSSSITSQTTGTGNAGDINITTGRFTARNGGFVATRARAGSTGNAGNLTVKASDAVEVIGRATNGAVSGITTEVELGGSGGSGNLEIETKQMSLVQGGSLFSRSAGFKQAGNINLKIARNLFMNDGDITALSVQSSGGAIQINAGAIQLQNRSNIFSFVLLDSGGGGSIDLTANSIIALDDSNILSFAQTGRGGNITLNTRAFFGQNYRPAPAGTDLSTFVENGRVDVNANGGIPGVITFPDTNFIQNSLTELSQTSIDTNTLLANRCIVRNQQNGSFYITGTGGLPINPGEISTYATGTVQPTWKLGDAIVEPQNVYQLPNGALVLSRECK